MPNSSIAGSVTLKCSVVSITHGTAAAQVVCEDGRTFKGSHVVLSMSPHLISKIHFRPPLGALRAQLQARMPVASCWKLHLFYRVRYENGSARGPSRIDDRDEIGPASTKTSRPLQEAFWRARGFSGSVEIVHGDNDSVCSILDDTSAGSPSPSLVGFVVGEKARKFLLLTPDQRRDSFVSTVLRVFKIPAAQSVRTELLKYALSRKRPEPEVNDLPEVLAGSLT